MKMSFFIAAALIATGASADTTIDMTTALKGTTARQMTVFSEGHMAGTLASTYERIEAGDGHPMTGMTGTCTGHMIVQLPAGSGGGLCAFSNDAGDRMVITYDITGLNRDGGVSGSWIAHGGGGTMAGVQGGGSFVNGPDAEDGTFDQQVTGAITLP
ncbi:hypothetical protein [uncultured Tateyamaria sp.]|uniref:hypothetical protein n=1 Tax=uncultured Tateyamaria sp. TaxID=455651 RepID=UPI00262A51EC|nr:hypothetical protein [uncultured Tateyamaria sp.]